MKPDGINERTEKLILANKKARFEYEVMQTIEAGIELRGTEVKSLRQKKCSIQEAYAAFPKQDSHELYLINFHINPYEHGNIMNHEPKRQRKLLIHYREAMKLKSAVQEKGLTLIPLSIYFSGPFVKVKIGLCRHKKKFDKREDKKKQDMNREIRKKFRV